MFYLFSGNRWGKTDHDQQNNSVTLVINATQRNVFFFFPSLNFRLPLCPLLQIRAVFLQFANVKHLFNMLSELQRKKTLNKRIEKK